MDENLKSQLDNISNEIDSRIEKAYGQALESATGKADEMIKGEVTNLVNKFNELNERLDASETAAKKRFEASKPASFKNGLLTALKDGAIESLVKGGSRSASFEVKADMTTGADFTGEVIAADRS